jgi:predicted nucleic acid-binding protein
MMYLLDTNVICELRKARTGAADPSVKRWAEHISIPDLHSSP